MSSPMIRLKAGWREAVAEHRAHCPRTHPVVGTTQEELERIRQVLGKISYRDWKMITFIDSRGVAFMQLDSLVPDSVTGQLIQNRSIPLDLCPEMSDGLIVDLAFELVKEYEMHEAAERFSVAGARVYFPHKPDGMPVFEVPSMRAAPSVPPAAPAEGGAK
jgi:hypothetical protein